MFLRLTHNLTWIFKVFNLFQFLFKHKTQLFWENIRLVSSSIKSCQIKWVLRKCRIISFKSYKNLPTSKDMYSEKKGKDLIDHSKVFFYCFFAVFNVRWHKCTPLKFTFSKKASKIKNLHRRFDIYYIASNRRWRLHQFLWPL